MELPIAQSLPRRRFQYSLKSGLLLIAVVAVGFSIWHSAYQANENARLERENGELREELGLLDVQEGREHLLHVTPQWSSAPLLWSWKVYVPPGKRLLLNMRTGQRSFSDSPRETRTVLIPEGKSEISVGIRNTAAGKWHCWVQSELGQDKAPFLENVPEPKFGNHGTSTGILMKDTIYAEVPLKLIRFEAGSHFRGKGDELEVWISEESPNNQK